MERVMRDIPNVDSSISPMRTLLLLIIAKTAKLLSGWSATPASDTGQNVNIALAKEIIADWNRAKNINSTTPWGYGDAKGLVELVKVISNEPIDDEET